MISRLQQILLLSTLLLTTLAVSAKGFPGPGPVMDTDYYDNGAPPPAKVHLGKILYFDKILSGNLNISCATCHHPMAWTGDGLSLPVGEGGQGLGVTRDTGTGLALIHERVPRHAPPVFNLGAHEFTRMFYDGRVEGNPAAPSGFDSPAGDDLPQSLENVLAVQAMFPVTSPAEMAGQAGENLQANAAAIGQLAGVGGVWDLIAEKLQAIPEYVELFKAAYPAGPDKILVAGDITYVHAANAIAAFEAREWRFDNSPYDQYLRGNKNAMSTQARIGMNIFYGKGGCSDCHSGAFQTDQDFHAVAMPQIGPGKGDDPDGHSDFGREQVTGYAGDRFRFRTPTLRNVALTAPYGHAGAYNTLEAVVQHKLDSVNALYEYDREQAVLPSRPDLDAFDFIVMDDLDRLSAIADASELDPVRLKEKDIQALLAFLHSLTDLAALDMRSDVPASVPSGLPVWD